MIVGITMQQPSGVVLSSHEVLRDGNVLRGSDSHRALLNAEAVYEHESTPSHHMHPPMNGGMHLQQVYVSSDTPVVSPEAVAMDGIENQFQSLGFKQEDSIGTDQLTSSAQNSECNNPDEIEIGGEESDEDPPLKLFVGQVRHMLENIALNVCFIVTYRF